MRPPRFNDRRMAGFVVLTGGLAGFHPRSASATRHAEALREVLLALQWSAASRSCKEFGSKGSFYVPGGVMEGIERGTK